MASLNKKSMQRYCFFLDYPNNTNFMVAFRRNECRTVVNMKMRSFFSKIETGICIFEKKTVTLRAFCAVQDEIRICANAICTNGGLGNCADAVSVASIPLR